MHSATTAFAAVVLSLTSQSPHESTTTGTSRRNVLNAAAAVTLLSPSAVSAFDLPPATKATFPEERKAYAARQNPDQSFQLTPALQAVINDDNESLQAMADAGWALTELADEAGRTVLHRAAMAGNYDAAKIMIKLGSDIDAYSKFMETPLHVAIRNNRPACVVLLVEAGASTSKKYGTKDDTALTLAQKYKLQPIIDYLKSKGATTGDAKGLYPCLAADSCSYGPS